MGLEVDGGHRVRHARTATRARRALAVLAVVTLPLATLGLSAPVSATGSTPSTTTLGSLPASPSGLGVAVTYTATVAPTSGTGATPTGTVGFTDGGTTVTGCGAVTLTPSTGSSATATCAEAASAMSGGNHTVVATYGGDGTYATSNATLTQVVNADSTTATVSSSPASPSSFGQAVTYTATVTANGGETAFTPTGTVGFTDGGTTITGCGAASLSAVSGGVAQATCTEAAAAMTVGTHNIQAVYTSTNLANFTGTTSAVFAQVVNHDATSIGAVASPPSPSGLGVAVSFLVTVSAQNSVTINPTGTPTGTDGSTALSCSALSGANGVTTSTCTDPASMTAGAHTIDITYPGDANFASATTGNFTQTVSQATTNTAVTSTTGTPSLAGQPVTYLATITPSSHPFTMTGTVTFKDGAGTIACSPVTVAFSGSTATASCTEAGSAMTPGTHSITAVYNGDTNYAGSTSSTLSQVVNQDATTTAVMSTANPSTGGLAVTYTATVSATGGSAFTPSGTVTFKDGSTVICTAVALSSASAQCTEPALSMTSGTHSITAVYSGDTNFTTSTGSLSQVVNPAPVTISESANPASPSGLGIGVIYTITLTAGNSSALIPGVTGVPPATSLTITDTPPGSSTPITLCTLSTPNSSGTTAGVGFSTWLCAESGNNMTAGAHTIGVSFAGDAYFGSTTTTFTQTVTNHPTGSTTAVTSPGSPSYPGQPVTYTATVRGDAQFAPAGTVAFTSGGTTIAGCGAVAPSASTGSSSTYTCTEAGTALPTGSQSIKAVFSGDTNYGTSSSSTITQVVSQGATSIAVGDNAGSTNPSLAGIPVTFLATVTPSETTAIEPTGTVTFYSNLVAIPGCIGVAVTQGASNSTATCTESSTAMTLGIHPTAAIYSGDSNYVGSDNTGSPFNQQVVQNTTTTMVVGPGGGPYPVGMPLTYTATVTASGAGNLLTPTGTITYSDPSGTVCAGATLTQVSPGVATASCTFSSTDDTVSPTDAITATYSGDTNYTASHGSTNAPVFVKATPVVTIASSSVTHPTIGIASQVNTAVTYTATFADPSGGLVTPTGTVTFMDGATVICTAPLTQSTAGTATAVCTNTPTTVGAHLITVTYGGDANYVASTNPNPATYTQNVVKYTTSIVITPPANGSTGTFPANNVIYPVWTPVTLQVTVTGSGTGATGPLNVGGATGSGLVTFYLNGTAIGGQSFGAPFTQPNCSGLVPSGALTATVTCSGFYMPRGNDTFTAAYLDQSGVTTFPSVLSTASSSPGQYTYQVVSYATNTQISVSPAAPVTGQPVTLTIPVVPSSGAAVLPTGTLTFAVNGTTVTCSAPATLNTNNPPVATCTLPSGLPGGSDVIQATYPGDTWYAASIGSLSLTVAKAATTVNGFTVAPASGSSATLSGQTLRISVSSVTANAPGAGTPTGTVAVTASSTAQTLCTITLVNGAGSCFDTSVQVPSGTPTFTATYSGDTGFTSSSATFSSLVIGPEKALVTGFTTSPATLVYGQPVTYTVTLTPQFAGTYATGTIAITSAETGALTLCTINLTTSSLNTGSCTFTPTLSTGFIPGGSVQFTATYSGDANFATGTTGQTNAYITKSTPGVAVTVNPQNPVYGQYPTFGITLTPTTSGTVPTGTVAVTSSQTGLTTLCTATFSGSGLTGTCTDTTLLTAQNNVTFTATYSGDGNFNTATGTTLTNVQQASTVTTVTPSPTSPAYGQTQTFSVTVAPQIAGVSPTGTVTITTPGVLQPLCTATLTAGSPNSTGSCSTTSTVVVPTGTSIVYQGTYSGDANFLASVGLSTGNSVVQNGSTTTLGLGSSSSVYGSEASQVFTATVVPKSGYSGTPTGTVAIKQGTTTLCTVTLSAGTGTCSPSATALPVTGSPFSLTAVYSGDANFTTSTSSSQSWTITKATAAVAAQVSTATVVYGDEAVATLTATVTSPGSGTPTGTVAFKNGSTVLCTATLANGVGSCAMTSTALARRAPPTRSPPPTAATPTSTRPGPRPRSA